MGDEVGMLHYHFEPSHKEHNYLELRFCITGNMYCRKYQDDCKQCKVHASAHCEEKLNSVDFVSLTFPAAVLEGFVKSRDNHSLSEDLLAFRHQSSFSRPVSLCGKMRMLLEGLLNHTYSGSLENIYVTAQTQLLLLNILDSVDEKQLNVITCRFLSNDADRDKILKAREILIQHIGEPITIKALSRKVAMNECYLKKGFKEMFGTTIFEFYQDQRMAYAKNLLYEKGLTVTEVSVMLGYSSISHFSTAFKKHTGLKPCELLFR
jgi:AraC family transcriptional regulator